MPTGPSVQTAILILARLEAITAVQFLPGIADLSGPDQVKFGDFTKPPIQGQQAFLAIGFPDIQIDLRDATPLTEYTNRLTVRIEGWQITGGLTPVDRLGPASILLGYVIGAIQADWLSNDAGSLKTLLKAVPAFENVILHRAHQGEGQTYGQFTLDAVFEYRKLGGI